MGCYVNWFDLNRRIVYMRLDAGWTAEDLIHGAWKWKRLDTAVPHDIAAIIDLSRARRMPPGLFVKLRRVATILPPGRYPIVIIGVNAIERSLVENVMQMLFPLALRSVTFAPDARTAAAQLTSRLRQSNLSA